MKLGHHGGKGSINEKMLTELTPETVVISTGFNTYGHPNREIIAILKDKNVKILRTDYNNAIKITISPKGTKSYTYKSNLKRFTRTVPAKKNQLHFSD